MSKMFCMCHPSETKKNETLHGLNWYNLFMANNEFGKSEKHEFLFSKLLFYFVSSNEHWITTIKININHQCLFRVVEFNSKITFCGLNSTLNKLQRKTLCSKFRKHRILCIFICAILSENQKQTASKTCSVECCI